MTILKALLSELKARSDQGIISLKLSGGKMAPSLVYYLLEKELLNEVKRHPGC